VAHAFGAHAADVAGMRADHPAERGRHRQSSQPMPLWPQNIFPKPWRIGSHSKISRFPNCGGCMGSKTGAGCLRAFCGSRPSTDLCAVHKEQCRDRRTLRRSSGFVRIAIIHSVRRGYRHARPADRAATAGAVLASPRPLARLRSTQAARRSLHERRARPPA